MNNDEEKVFCGNFLVQGILNYSYSVNLVPVGPVEGTTGG